MEFTLLHGIYSDFTDFTRTSLGLHGLHSNFMEFPKFNLEFTEFNLEYTEFKLKFTYYNLEFAEINPKYEEILESTRNLLIFQLLTYQLDYNWELICISMNSK